MENLSELNRIITTDKGFSFTVEIIENQKEKGLIYLKAYSQNIQIAEAYYSIEKDSKEEFLCLRNITVEKVFRFKGIGKALINFLKDIAINKGLNIEGIATNNSIEFYKKLGFSYDKITHSIKWFYWLC